MRTATWSRTARLRRQTTIAQTTTTAILRSTSYHFRSYSSFSSFASSPLPFPLPPFSTAFLPFDSRQAERASVTEGGVQRRSVKRRLACTDEIPVDDTVNGIAVGLPLLMLTARLRSRSTANVRFRKGEVSNASGRFVSVQTLPTFRACVRDGDLFQLF